MSGERQANINIADGKKSSVMLAAQGEAEAILAKAQATAKGIQMVSETLQGVGGHEGRVKQKVSSGGKYVSVNIGPVQVMSSEQVQAVYSAMRRDDRMKYFL